MIDLASIQQQLAQPETPFDRAMSDPLFNIGIALMSSPNIGTALQQGLKTTQSMRSNRLQNQMRLLQLQAQLQPKTAEPTALMRHMEIAQDPNNPLSQMMQKYLFKPTGTNVTVKLPGQVVQGMEKIPGYLGPGPDEGTYYRMSAQGTPEIGYLPGAQKPSQAERQAAQGIDEFGLLTDTMEKDEAMFVDPGAHVGQVAADVASQAGPITGAIVNSITPERNQAYNVMGDRLSAVVVKDVSGTAASDAERAFTKNQITVRAGDGPQTIARKQAIRKGMHETMAKKGRAYLTIDEFNEIVGKAESSRAKIVPTAPQAQPGTANLSPWAQRVLSTGAPQ